MKERARKNPIEVGRFWLLKREETEPFIKCTLSPVFPGKSEGFSGKNGGNSVEESLKKSKVNKSIYNTGFSPELERVFQIYLLVRKNNFGEIPEEQIQALRDDLRSLSDKEEERIAIVKKATASGWKSFYKMEKKRENSGTKKGKVKDNNNFERRKYDMEALERSLLGDGQ